MIIKTITRVWTFESDSNPNIEYETLQNSDGSTSCNCKGWTRRVASDGTRSCKHTRLVDMGIANRNCKATHNYQETSKRKEINNGKQIKIPKLGHRKFAL
jgi:hypothetical protein